MGTLLITSSNIVALWQLIVISSRNEGIAIKDAIQIVRDSGLVGGDTPANEGFKLGRHCELLQLDNDQKLYLSDYCKRKLLAICDTDEPNTPVVRGILLKYASTQTLEWLLF